MENATRLEEKTYCLNLFAYQRIPSLEVNIGGIPLGGNQPIRIQSMTTTDTMDTAGTIAQSLRMVESGSEYVRITAPSIKEAQNLELIRKGLREVGCNVPLVADIHFTPNAAEVAAKIVEKVRVNPGNYADKKKFKFIEYTDEQYEAELERIAKRFLPLVELCKEHGAAMRIGTNHGSLSDRIMSRYGDTPLGMVESALEFLRICEANDYREIVISMKASNPQIMVQAYRHLMHQMLENGAVYPLHLGVTEAGEGEDGRIKSALGISTLLIDGIGDTVRVSLTEEPEYESPVAQFLVNYAQASLSEDYQPLQNPENPVDPFAFRRRASHTMENLGHDQVPRVLADYAGRTLTRAHLAEIGYTYAEALDKYSFSDMAADYIYLGDKLPAFDLPGGLKPIYDYPTWNLLRHKESAFPFYRNLAELYAADDFHPRLNFVRVSPADLKNPENLIPAEAVLVAECDGREAPYYYRSLFAELKRLKLTNPVILCTQAPESFSFYNDDHLPEKYRLTRDSQVQLYLTSQVAPLVIDGLLDGLWLGPGSETVNRTAFGILQAGRMRITKTEYISCPSCGRTLFDLQETTARIRKRTEHLKGVKIGIMGCIVNGPGEMADADYGYVGVGPDKIALYRGQEVVEKGVKTAVAVDLLIDLIKADGKWVEV
ncbi:MAG: (E)-4-hydroxy-3-methylbut-2-enyl-diphosphate synthase [Bacteroidia bacterium]|nr:(E)-4-hydroxy-3-methylbut-2-enyl-diphosphate synthase [Bacteroidia bacterium]